MSDQRQKIENNIRESQAARKASRYSQPGLNHEKGKLSSKNFDRLMQQRGLSKEERTALLQSNDRGTPLQARHAKAGESFVTTHGTQNSSGIFLSEQSLGKTAAERVDKGALPHSNSAEYETKVELGRDQNLVYGKIAPQPHFTRMDPSQKPRNGGAEQVISDGGYRSGAVVNRDAKYPVSQSRQFARTLEPRSHSQGSQTATGQQHTASRGQAH